MLDRQLDHLLDLLDLLVAAANHVVGGVGYLLDLHERHERVHLGWQHQVQCVRVVAQCDAVIDVELADVDRLVDIDDVLALRVDLDEHLLTPHDRHQLAHVRARLLQQRQLLAQVAHHGVQLIALGLETT